MKNTVAILINDDGETWGGVDGASICLITDKQYEALADGLISTGELKPILELGLRDYTEGTMR
jgi:hypothetical protein